jgi:TetR/AcrR family acrAB operon transcriptional repressor
MVRRTKAEAEQTRQEIIAAARRVFHERGVRCCSLEQIALAAGVTRGAVYWHFKDKSALFFAVRNEGYEAFSQRVGETLAGGGQGDPLVAVAEALKAVFDMLARDEMTRQTLEILLLRCEYTGELADALQLVFESHRHLQDALQGAYERAAERGSLRAGLEPELLAMETLTFLTGLLERWIVDRGGRIASSVAGLIDCHVALRRAA